MLVRIPDAEFYPATDTFKDKRGGSIRRRVTILSFDDLGMLKPNNNVHVSAWCHLNEYLSPLLYHM